jgi:hypothetical protein
MDFASRSGQIEFDGSNMIRSDNFKILYDTHIYQYPIQRRSRSSRIQLIMGPTALNVLNFPDLMFVLFFFREDKLLWTSRRNEIMRGCFFSSSFLRFFLFKLNSYTSQNQIAPNLRSGLKFA